MPNLDAARKKALRQKISALRREIPPTDKARLDEKILAGLARFAPFSSAAAVLCYVAKDFEVETRPAINLALNLGKTVAVPGFFGESGKMGFFAINGFDDLVPGRFGVLQPGQGAPPL